MLTNFQLRPIWDGEKMRFFEFGSDAPPARSRQEADLGPAPPQLYFPNHSVSGALQWHPRELCVPS